MWWELLAADVVVNGVQTGEKLAPQLTG